MVTVIRQSNERTKDFVRFHRQVCAIFNAGSFKPNIVHAHPPPVQLRVLHKALWSSKCGSVWKCCGKRTKPYLKTVPVLTGWFCCCCCPAVHFAPVRLVARQACGSVWLASAPGEDIHIHTERRGCVVRHTVAGLFLSSTSEFEGRSQRGLIFTERQRGGLFAWREGKEERGGRKGGKGVLMLNLIPFWQ